MKFLLSFTLLALIFGCKGGGPVSKDEVAKILKENPEIMVDAMKAKPTEFFMAIQEIAKDAQKEVAKKRENEEKKKLEEAFNKPLKPNIRKDESIRGTKNAPIVLVEYSDFECPFCSRGYKTVMDFMKKYEGKVQFIYKHLPLSFHANANLASKYYEAIRLDNEGQAFKFHDEIFNNQRKLKNGEKFLKSIAKKVGADMSALAKNLKNPKVQQRIDEDLKEAASFGMQGTPGFLLNGVPIKGAYPLSHFENIIEELKKRGKLQL